MLRPVLRQSLMLPGIREELQLKAPRRVLCEKSIPATKYVLHVHGHLAMPALSSTLLESFLEAFEQFINLHLTALTVMRWRRNFHGQGQTC